MPDATSDIYSIFEDRTEGNEARRFYVMRRGRVGEEIAVVGELTRNQAKKVMTELNDAYESGHADASVEE